MNTIADYASSSDEETEQPTVKLEANDEGTEQPTLKREANEELEKTSKKMPKLPSFFNFSDDKVGSSDSNGKKRTVPHKPDSWATYVYFQVDLTDEKEKLANYCTGLELIDEQHISISRTIYLKYHELDPFVTCVKNASLDMKPFDISFAQTACLTNDENTRSFLTLEIGSGYSQLLDCMKEIDRILKVFKQPTYYDPPRFHTSIGWSLNKDSVTSIKIPQSCMNSITTREYYISRLYIKQGHLIKHIDLQ